MAKINDGTLKDWKDGDKVTADLYEADREILRAAINDTDSKTNANTTTASDHTKRITDLEYNVTGTVVPMTFKELGMQNLTFDDIKLGYVDKQIEKAWQPMFDSFVKGVSEDFTATDGQTVFTTVNGYTTGTSQIMVEVDGVPQDNSSFTETDGHTVTLSEPLVAGQKVRVTIGKVQPNADARFSSMGTEIDGLTTQMAEKAKQSDTSKEFNPIKGITLYLGDPSYAPTQATIDASISNIKNAGFTDVFILVYYNQTDGNTGTTIVQSTSDSFITTNIQKCKDAGLNVRAIKFHLFGITSSSSLAPSNVTTWFTNYKSGIMHIATVCQSYGIEYFVVSNERTDMTQLASNVASWQDIINSVKALGYKTMVNCTYDEAYLSKILPYVDAIGVNMYPHMSNAGVNATLQECIQAWKHDLAGREWLATIDYMKATYNKPVFISEVGCPSAPTSLSNPENWNVGTYTPDYNVQNKFFLATLYVLGTYSNVDGMVVWEGTTSKYNPFNEPVNTTLKQFFGVVQ
jgi:hypothetical protein